MPDAPTAEPKLLSPRHERFSQFMASGDMAAWEAYRSCYPKCDETSARSLGPRLYGKVHIRERVREIQTASAKSTAMGIDEWRGFMEDVMRTPIGEVDEHHHLAQEMTYKVLEGKRPKAGEEPDPSFIMVKVKMPSKLEAGKILGGHHGWNGKDKLEVSVTDSLLDVLSQIRQPGIPKMSPEALAEELAARPIDGPPNPPFFQGGGVLAPPAS